MKTHRRWEVRSSSRKKLLTLAQDSTTLSPLVFDLPSRAQMVTNRQSPHGKRSDLGRRSSSLQVYEESCPGRLAGRCLLLQSLSQTQGRLMPSVDQKLDGMLSLCRG